MGSLSRVLTCFSPLLERARCAEDTKEDRLRKDLLLPFAFVIAVVAQTAAVVSLVQGRYISVALTQGTAAVCLAFLVFVLNTKSCTEHVAGVFACALGCFFLLCDIITYGWIGYSNFNIVIMDIMLLCRCHGSATNACFGLTLVVVAAMSLEQAYGVFGVFEAIQPEWIGYDRPTSNGGKHGYFLFTVRVVVFSSDYSMTRYFSKGMREQKERVERSVAVAQQIASALARFDLDAAEEMVEVAEGLPPELLNALSCLLGNLRSYKPYLPQSCLPDEVEEQETDDATCEVSNVNRSRSLSSSQCMDHAPSTALKCVTLLQVNVRNFRSIVNTKQPCGVAETHAQYIAEVLVATRGSRGLVEHFLCDRVLISFNAAKQCLGHRMQGLLCAQRLQSISFPGTLTMAVSSGEVVTGPMGCDGLRSYALVGLLGAWVPLFERLAVRLSLCTVTDTSVVGHTHEFFSFRLLANASFEKEPSHVMQIYEYLGQKDVQEEEWMYQLAQEDTWHQHNAAKRRLLEGDPQGARILSQHLPVRGAHELLLKEIESACQRPPQPRSLWMLRDLEIEESATQSHPLLPAG